MSCPKPTYIHFRYRPTFSESSRHYRDPEYFRSWLPHETCPCLKANSSSQVNENNFVVESAPPLRRQLHVMLTLGVIVLRAVDHGLAIFRIAEKRGFVGEKHRHAICA